uniref:Uncharacterized protein n=1 Tax=Timema poppense TaxID=170557 RepID=A0A7R9DVT7_TIMPO|nr:unnamed protein product [Timema poppensis]
MGRWVGSCLCWTKLTSPRHPQLVCFLWEQGMIWHAHLVGVGVTQMNPSPKYCQILRRVK